MAKRSTANTEPTRTITYDELTGGLIRKPVIQALAKSGSLDADGARRLAHLGRFLLRVGESARPDLAVGAVWTEKELQRLWRGTADEGDHEVPTRPLLDCQPPPN